ncbi:hypothetical protein HDU91_004779 [Kappamyces sp. JEL0680]|nr:hypothetical protein HDU91_004779 [Kappamyces sp. JEL0680]
MTNADNKTLALATLLLCCKFYGTILVQGGKRFSGGSRPPEDEALSLNQSIGKGKTQTFGVETLPASEADDKVMRLRQQDIRWQRIVLNDLENIPMGLVVAFVSILVGANATVTQASICVFTLARFFHTWAYANELQPHRAIGWGLGLASIFVMAANGAWAALFY